LSKLSKLKQEAYLAGKKRNWDEAISIYEKILEIDKNNPALINELGDICLKTDNTKRAISLFLSAASKYAKAELSNNAIAVYKKVLRHDADNWNAHWYLCKLRAEMELVVDGREHAEKFLASSSSNSPEFKEIFLKRCQEMMSLYQMSESVLESLIEVFRLWNLPLDVARCQCLLACLLHLAGRHEEAETSIDQTKTEVPEIVNYTEYSKWQNLVEPDKAPQITTDVNAIDLDQSAAEVPVSETSAPPAGSLETSFAPTESVVSQVEELKPLTNVQELNNQLADSDEKLVDPIHETITEETPPSDDPGQESTFESIVQTTDTLEPKVDTIPESTNLSSETEGTGFDDTLNKINRLTDKQAADESKLESIEKDDEGCIQIDINDGGGTSDSEDDDLAAIIGSLPENTHEEIEVPDVPEGPETTDSIEEWATDLPFDPEPIVEEEPVDLLAAILDEESDDDSDQDANQVNTIASSIGQQVGANQAEVPEQQYEMGLVFLEMGMFEQAAESFAVAAQHRESAVRAFEMWGISLRRAGDNDQAIEIFTQGLAIPDIGDDEQIGLLYHTGRSYEEAGQPIEAAEFYEKVSDISSTFLDVTERISKLAPTDT